jgi:large-conductance mechanosensitive channel
MKFNATHEIVGWIGMSIILVAYGFNAFGLIQPQSLIYALANIFGSVGIIYASFYKKDYQPVVLNFIWIAIAIFLIIKVLI